jgi:ABC-type Fe3+ transport system permease subunit
MTENSENARPEAPRDLELLGQGYGNPTAKSGGFDWSQVVAAAPPVVIVLICSVLPLAWMAAIILANPAVRREFSLDSFRLALLGRTVGYNALAAVIAAVMGLPAAFVLGRGRGVLARVLWVVLPAALLLPSLSYAYGWSQEVRLVLNWVHNNETLMAWLDRHGIAPVIRPNSAADVFRCIWSLASWLWAVPACVVGMSLRRMDTNVQQQAVLDGALRRVTLRQLVGPIIASMAIVTILATQEFSVYEPTGISVVATEVRMVFDTGSVSSVTNQIAAPGYIGAGLASPDQPARAAAAVATATPLLIVTVFLAIIAAWGARKAGAAEALSVGDWPPVLDVSRWTIVLTILLLALNIGVPVYALIRSLAFGISPQRMTQEFGPQLRGALIVACEATAVALVVSFFSAARWVPGSLAVAGASFLVGGQLLAIGLIRIYNRRWLDWAYDTSVVTVIAYMGRFGWLAIAAGLGTWSRPWRELREMASVDGASTLRIATAVVWPLAWPMLLAGGLLVGALSLTEVPATVLLLPQNPQVLTPTLMTWVHMARYDPMIEASLLMMATVLIPAVAAVLLTSAGLRVLKAARGR